MITKCENRICRNEIYTPDDLVIQDQKIYCTSCTKKKAEYDKKLQDIRNNPFLREIRECYIKNDDD